MYFCCHIIWSICVHLWFWMVFFFSQIDFLNYSWARKIELGCKKFNYEERGTKDGCVWGCVHICWTTLIRNGIFVRKICKILNWTCDAEAPGSHIVLKWTYLKFRFCIGCLAAKKSGKFLFIWTYLNLRFCDGCLATKNLRSSGLVSVAKSRTASSFIFALVSH